MTIYEIRELKGADEMVATIHLLQQLTPELTETSVREMLPEMIRNGYRMFGVFDQKKCIGLTGTWINTKLYSGKYLEIDNFVTDSDYHSLGVGKQLLNFVEQLAKKENCKCMMLDAYTTNPSAHKFYYREGFVIKGFHFLNYF